ncbi:MAG TPA: urease accessory protein UreE [Rhizomicrobium sp.]|nr:urease accessory protein UreE [Rhizomicrobium sp.]
MRHATHVLTPDEYRDQKVAGHLRLDHHHRHRRRLTLKTEEGETILLDLPAAVHLRGGDKLVLDDGAIIDVEALDEPLLQIIATDISALIRIAWHLGNRHLPTQLIGTALRIREDHVLEDMVRRLGATVTHVVAPFDPEGGAYAGFPGHHHGHAHQHDDGHAHGG